MSCLFSFAGYLGVIIAKALNIYTDKIKTSQEFRNEAG